jgi:flagellar biosynthesis chaperone FliJ
MHNMKGDVRKLLDFKNDVINRIAVLRQKLHKEQIELEKYTYLENDVLKKELHKKKIQERNETDEVAILLTNFKRRS